MSDIKALLKNASLPERLVSIVTDRALAAEYQHLSDQLDLAQKRRASDARAGSDIKKIAREIEAVQDKMRASTIEFKLRGMRAAEWRALKAEHPISDEPNQLDRYLGADTNGLFNAAVRKAIVSPQLDDDDWDNLLDALTEGEWQRFTDAIYAMNEEGTGIPFSRAASMLLQESDDD